VDPTLHADWEACIDRLYDAVGREEELALALGDFRRFFGAQGVMFLTAPDASRAQTMHIGALGVSTDSLLEYHSHFGQYDVWAQAAWARQLYGQLQPFRGSDLVPRRQLKRTYFWKEFLLRDGVIDILAALVEAPSPATAAMTVTFQRHHGQGTFKASDVPRLAALAPHLRRAMRLHRRLTPRLALGSTLLELFQAADLPMAFLAHDGRVIDQNAAAQSSLNSREGVWRLHAGRLSCRDGQGWNGLEPQLARLKSEPAFTLSLIGGSGEAASLEVRRVHGAMTDRLAQHEAVAVCTLRPRRSDAAEALRSRFGLTSSETKITLALTEGATTAEVAKAFGLQVSTVRTHLKAAMSKMGVGRQAQMVAAVLRLG
jgi:DNA-binding CsgD family transcriptional regulator